MGLRDKGKTRRRQRILQAVVDIVAEDGVKGLTTNQIAQKAEVSVATLYNLIGSIDDILDQLVSAQSELVAQS
ncbi:MAG: TetR/AcrR family transcriptional regulator, partial [Halioglobus sp.]